MAPYVAIGPGGFAVIGASGIAAAWEPQSSPSVPAASVANIAVAEDVGTAVFTVTLDSAPASPVSIDYATQDGTAVAGQDYTATSGTLNFGIGVTSQPINVTITDDPDPEVSETFSVVLSNPSGCTIADGTGVCTISTNDGAPLHTLTLTDTSGSGSSGFFRAGLAFEQGDVPSGQILTGEADSVSIPLAMMETNTWPDGSLRKATVVGNASSFTASQTKTIEVSTQAGTQGTSGVDPFTYLGTQDDLIVQVRNHTGSADNTGVGDLDFSIQTAAATTTRREITDDTPVCVRAFVWQQAGADKHLVCLNYVDLWISTGTVQAVEWAPVTSQHWIIDDPFADGAQTKQLRNYDTTILSGSTTLESFTGLAHAYYCRAAFLRAANDDQHAKPIWIDKGVAMPTLRVEYSTASREKIMRSGVMPPIDLSQAYAGTDLYTTPASNAGGIENTYAPLGTNGHRAGINGTGGYIGRGLTADAETKAWVQQTSLRWRQARVMAQAGLSFYGHWRDHQVVSTDVSAGLRPLPLRSVNGGTNSYTGLGAEGVTVRGAINTPQPGVTISEVDPVGGTGAFTSHDAAHAHNYSFLMAFVEGDAHLRDAVLSLADFQTRQINWNNLGHDARVIHYNHGTRASVLGLPSAQQGAVIDFPAQDRNWAPGVWASSLALVADSDRHRSYLENYAENLGAYLDLSMSLFPASQLAFGTLEHDYQAGGPSFHSFTALALYQMAAQAQGTTRTRLLAAAAQAARLPVRMLKHGVVSLNSYRTGIMQSETTFTDYLPSDKVWQPTTVTISAATDQITTAAVLPPDGTEWSAGAELYFSERGPDNFSFDAQVPTEVSLDTVYYAQNVSGTFPSLSFQISTDPGGANIVDFTSDYTVTSTNNNNQVVILVNANFESASVLPHTVTDDDFIHILRAAIHMAWANNHPDLTQADMQKLETYYAPVAQNDRFSPFMYESEPVRSYA